jgi:hypothetical protein
VVEGLEIPANVVELIEGGVATWVATRDETNAPFMARAVGTRVGPQRRTLAIFVPNEQGGRTLDNLRANARIAVMWGRPTDFRAAQIKGRLIGFRPSDFHDRQFQEQYMGRFMDASAKTGMSRDLYARMIYWPSTAIEVAVEEVFVQTPGPGAGAPWR